MFSLTACLNTVFTNLFEVGLDALVGRLNDVTRDLDITMHGQVLVRPVRVYANSTLRKSRESNVYCLSLYLSITRTSDISDILLICMKRKTYRDINVRL